MIILYEDKIAYGKIKNKILIFPLTKAWNIVILFMIDVIVILHSVEFRNNSMEDINIRFKTKHNGLSQILGTLEKEVMKVLWKKNESSGKNIFKEIQQFRKVAYTTVLTVVDRLVKKRFIKKEKKEGIYIYAPSFTEKEFNDYVTRKVIQGLLKLSTDATIINFVDILSQIDKKQIEEVYALIKMKTKKISKIC